MPHKRCSFVLWKIHVEKPVWNLCLPCRHSEKAAAGGLYLYSGRGPSLKPVALGTWFKFSWPSCQGSVEGYIMAETSSKMGKMCRCVLGWYPHYLQHGIEPRLGKKFVNAHCPTWVGKVGLGMGGFQRRWTEEKQYSCVEQLCSSSLCCGIQSPGSGRFSLCDTALSHTITIPESASGSSLTQSCRFLQKNLCSSRAAPASQIASLMSCY